MLEIQKVSNLGSTETRKVSWDVFQEIKTLQIGGYGAPELADVYALTGEIISRTAALEHGISGIVTYLLNPDAQERTVHAVRELMASKKLDMLESLIPETDVEGERKPWADGAILVKEIRKAAEFRNTLAHGEWSHYRVTDDGTLEHGTFLSSSPRKTGRPIERVLTADDLRNHLEIVRALALARLIAEHWVARYRGAVPHNASIAALAWILSNSEETRLIESLFNNDYDIQEQWNMMYGVLF